MADSILIQQLQTKGIIGVYAEERQQPQTLLLDIELNMLNQQPALTDDLQDTIDYATVCHTVTDFVSQNQFQLLETLAERIANLLLTEFAISHCRLTIYKKPFDLPQVKQVAVQIERENTNLNLQQQIKNLQKYGT